MKPTREQLIAWGKLGGLARSAAKAKASRENGKLGGRPKKIINFGQQSRINTQHT
jgi:hypothetical protein